MLKKILIVVLLIFIQNVVIAQSNDTILFDSTFIKENILFQNELNSAYRSEDHSPLDKKAKKNFIGHSFYDFDINYRVKAKLTLTPTARVFQIKTSKDRHHDYRKYGILTFKINGVALRLSVYQSESSKNSEDHKDYLFLPFKDRTNSHQTYGGGRYIDMKIPEVKTDSIVIDFNKAYNPYCHYSPDYSCPLVPRENHLLVEIRAGVKKYSGKLSH